jgi:hypothetical protein
MILKPADRSIANLVRWSIVCFFLSLNVCVSQDKSPESAKTDWLIDGDSFVATIEPSRLSARIPNSFELGNGLVGRTFLLDPPIAATISVDSHARGQHDSITRAIKPEATVSINGQVFDVGGLIGQPNHAFLKPEWISKMKPSENAMRFVGHTVGMTKPRFPWKKIRHAANETWPPPGKSITLEFEPPESSDLEFRVFVHYELYDHIPVFSKWLTIENHSEKPITVDRFASEILAVVEHESRVESREGVAVPKPESIHVETDFAFGGFNHQNANRHIVHWRSDPEYKTQVNYKRETPCLLVVEPTYGPDQTIAAGEKFESCRTFELIFDSTDRERQSLSLRKMYRTIAPWTTENPLMHHLRVSDPKAVLKAIDDAALVGFEMIILSFGSGFNMEDDSPEHLQQWKEVAEYSKSKNVEIGGYSLLSSRKIGNGNNIVSPEGQTPAHGNCPALTSEWGQDYYRKLYDFFDATGFTLLEHDGPYPGDVDVTSRPPLQKGISDSRWVQGKIANRFYRWCREKGIYVNAPDYYFLNGTNKCGMGYREVNWSLPREMQVIHTRQNIFDGTWSKTPSMGWMFVPLSEYHGGGAAATIEPLDEHLDHYQQMLQSNLGLGVQACYRGPRLFDTDRTRDMLARNVAWFKKYREILESDVVHGKRADGRDLDWMLHVNPHLKRKGMLLVYNPTDDPITKSIRVSFYYTGLTDTIVLKEKDSEAKSIQLDRDYCRDIEVTVEANGMNWFVIE